MNTRDRTIIDSYTNDYEMTYRKLASLYGLTFQRVHQIITRNISKEYLKGWKETKLLWKFLQSIEIGKPDECWVWTGRFHKTGYGYSNVARISHSHRFMYWLVNGEIAVGQVVMHSCDNRACCNINHLSLGTLADNNHDRDSKGRGRGQFLFKDGQGIKNNNAKLSEEDVIRIRNLLETGITPSEVSRMYGVSVTQIINIKNRKQWTHI